jgi:ferric-dicitrate binding protein FerR (iron transport regulator)
MPPENDNDLASLLRAAGVRVQGPEQISPEVKAAVEAEWLATRAAQTRRRKRIAITTAAVVLVVAAVAWIARPLYIRSNDPLARPSGFRGAVEYKRDGNWTPLTEEITLKAGDNVRTGDSGRVQLKLVNGVTIVFDAQTRLALSDLNHMELRRGAVYIDSGPVSKTDLRKLRLKTPNGNIKQYGARYEVRIVDDEVHVSVRSGHILVVLPDSEVGGDGGERLIVEDNNVRHEPLAANDGTFAWLER